MRVLRVAKAEIVKAGGKVFSDLAAIEIKTALRSRCEKYDFARSFETRF